MYTTYLVPAHIGTDGIIKKIREVVGDKPVYLSIDVRFFVSGSLSFEGAHPRCIIRLTLSTLPLPLLLVRLRPEGGRPVNSGLSSAAWMVCTLSLLTSWKLRPHTTLTLS